MEITGKCPPNASELSQAAEMGFDYVELYLERSHLDRYEETKRVTADADVAISSIHTPHARLDQPEYFERADRLATELDAFLVVHSSKIDFCTIPRLRNRLDFSAPHGFENDRQTTIETMKELVLSEDRNLVLDIAHLYAAEQNHVALIDHLLSKYCDQIPVVHFTDGTEMRDNLPLGSGSVALSKIKDIFEARYDGRVVLEVMPENQREARRWFKRH